jgi:hypothetical protein
MLPLPPPGPCSSEGLTKAGGYSQLFHIAIDPGPRFLAIEFIHRTILNIPVGKVSGAGGKRKEEKKRDKEKKKKERRERRNKREKEEPLSNQCLKLHTIISMSLYLLKTSHKTGAHCCIAQAGLELKILLPQLRLHFLKGGVPGNL